MTQTITMPDPMARPAKPPSNRTFKGRLSNNLKQRRIDAGLSVKDAASWITKGGYKASASLIYQWERGVVYPMIDGFPAIAWAYCCEIHELLPEH